MPTPALRHLQPAHEFRQRVSLAPPWPEHEVKQARAIIIAPHFHAKLRGVVLIRSSIGYHQFGPDHRAPCVLRIQHPAEQLLGRRVRAPRRGELESKNDKCQMET